MIHSLRVVCFGGRDFNDFARVNLALSAVRTTFGDFLVIHGGARGADTLCGDWALRRGLPVIVMPAPWDALGKQAGPARNGWIVDYTMPTYAVEFPGGTGTADMHRRLAAAGVPIYKPY